MPIAKTNAKVENLVEPEVAWREMRRQNDEQPYSACFPRSVSSGQPVRVRAVLQPPRFYSYSAQLGKASSQPASAAALSAQGASSGLGEKAGGKAAEEAMHPDMARHVKEERDAEYARCFQANMTDEKARFFSEIAADQARLKWQADSRRKAEGCGDRQPWEPVLVGTNSWRSGEGVCVLPQWVMESLGLVDGDEVQVEALQPPLNEARRSMTRGVGRFSAFWYCGRKKKRASTGVSTHHARCGPDKGEPCPQCEAVDSPDCSGGLPDAKRVEWRLPSHHLAGEVLTVLKGGQHLGGLFNERGLKCAMQGVAVPLVWASPVSLADSRRLFLRPEALWASDDNLIPGKTPPSVPLQCAVPAPTRKSCLHHLAQILTGGVLIF
jgi:hypothetical protein